MNGLNNIGDKTREWIKFAKKWKDNNPPQDNGCYLCGVCGRWCPAEEVVLDHIKPRSSSPHLIFSEENIQPAHYICNARKGSIKITPIVDREVYEFLSWLSSI